MRYQPPIRHTCDVPARASQSGPPQNRNALVEIATMSTISQARSPDPTDRMLRRAVPAPTPVSVDTTAFTRPAPVDSTTSSEGSVTYLGRATDVPPGTAVALTVLVFP